MSISDIIDENGTELEDNYAPNSRAREIAFYFIPYVGDMKLLDLARSKKQSKIVRTMIATKYFLYASTICAIASNLPL